MKHVGAALLIVGLAGATAAFSGPPEGAAAGGRATRAHKLRKGPPEFVSPRSKKQVNPANAPKLLSTLGAAAVTPPSVQAKLLVISADGTEVVLPVIRQVLEYMGTPYTVYVASRSPGGLTHAMLSEGNTGRYQGVILTTGNLAYFNGNSWTSALSPEEWTTLAEYQARNRVRQVTWYTFPTGTYGFQSGATEVDTGQMPLTATLTTEGARVFSYLNPTVQLRIKNAYAYLARPDGVDTTALLQDGLGNALVAVKRYPDGRENLALTFDGAPFLVHSVALSYGAINWVTRGLFLGYRRIFVSAQVDDLFLEDDIYGGGSYRMKGWDLDRTVEWQRAISADPQLAGWKMDMAFNGEGITLAYAGPNDTLTPAALRWQSEFKWISHTYTHPDLNVADYAGASMEVTENNRTALALGLTSYSPLALVTPDVSGLYNPEAMSAMYANGIRFLVSDTSRPGEDNPYPNTGIYNALQPGVFEIPRRPTNLYYNVSTPAEWMAEYNDLYRGYWGRDLTYNEILEKEADVIFLYMLRGENDPLMFHQPNLRAYDGTHSLMSDLLDRVWSKYKAVYNLPVTSPTMKDLGVLVDNQTRYVAAGVTATITGNTITVSSPQDVVVPITGLRTADAQVYGGQPTAFVQVRAGESMTFTQPEQ
ncbi:MAG TPA: hypothetical protein VK447_02845 [Myxococcaceae bacterium]|nr:hypothetical protein [Myxococcaceae bacterium]